MALAIAGAGATFVYQYVLESIRDNKAKELAAVEATTNRATIDEFIRLRDRLVASRTILDGHVALSQYFDVLEALTLKTVSYDSLELVEAEGGRIELTMNGEARTFNTLAAQSAAFASEKRIKRAIFSDIQVTQSGRVSFSLSAELAPELIRWQAPVAALPVAPSAPAATTTTP